MQLMHWLRTVDPASRIAYLDSLDSPEFNARAIFDQEVSRHSFCRLTLHKCKTVRYARLQCRGDIASIQHQPTLTRLSFVFSAHVLT